ncbi:CpsD/CapB family tyrosine-protein kinase [Paenibacillus sp. SC116]|uniref:CpsD/CapB family tyrosine-protein kinase n=1 Tax=Paenibacillus sp. SC116 TaxID=2968986 RepID=UPI00215AE71E|nr:CpsD/CapB family tyrosine-protein kinase [Paenibacillus sp. SC116]MCR8842237.1 CpsD/CapB family tyrosine-protein kinase [Paenibacillus sp. SC116]
MSRLTRKSKLITAYSPLSPISEVYRTLRTNIQFSSIDCPMKSIMITSSREGEGKSTTLVNAAVAYAQSNMKVVIVDADLRKPTVHEFFHLSNRVGVTNVLAQQASLESVMLESGIPNLKVIPAGTIPPNPSELLSSPSMTSFMTELSESYDLIFVDTPPVLLVADAQIMAAKCDGVLLVVQYGRIKREEIRKAKANLELVNANLLGTVLNQYKAKVSSRYHYYRES